MRILVISPYLPWPLQSGGNAAQFSLLSSLSSRHEFTLLVPLWWKHQEQHLKEFERELSKVRVYGVPVWKTGRAPARLPLRAWRWARSHMRTLKQAARCVVQAWEHSPQQDRPRLHYPFDPLPVAFVEKVESEAATGYDLIQVEFAELMPLGCWLGENVPKLFVHHQIHFVVADRFLQANGSSSYGRYMKSWIRAQELAYLRHYDGIIALSQTDRAILANEMPAAAVFFSPFAVPTDAPMVEQTSGAFRGEFCFLGSQDHAPNRDGLEWLLAEIWPRIRRRMPAARLAIIGQWGKRHSFDAEGVAYRGFIPNLAEAIDGTIMLVPIRIGSGIRTKILAAMARGVPVISTMVGCEGLPIKNGIHLEVADDASRFAESAVRLAERKELRVKQTAAALQVMRQLYAPEVVSQIRAEVYSLILRDKQARVGQGSMMDGCLIPAQATELK